MNATAIRLVLTLAVLLPFSSLPLFSLGYWDKAEPLVLGLHLCGALSAFVLAWEGWRRPAFVLGCISHPFVLLPLALALYSALVAPLTLLPWLSLSGAPQSGFGAGWHLDLALLIAVARLARTDKTIWTVLIRLALVAVTIICIIKIIDRIHDLRGELQQNLLIWIPAYYSWLGLALPAAVLGGAYRSRGFVLLTLAVAALAVGIGLSIASAVAAILGIGGFLLLRRFPGGWKWGSAAIAATLALPGLAVAFLPAARTILSLNDRHSLLIMVWAELSGWEPWRWLTGVGWGRTQDIFQIHLSASGQTLWDNSWIFMSSDYFHCHNALAEALLAAGLPGMLLTLAMPASLPIFCAPDRRPHALGFGLALATVMALWFPLAMSLPLIAIAFAAVAPDPDPVPVPVEGGKGKALAFLPAAAGLALTAAIIVLFQFGRDIGAARDALFTGAASLPAIPRDPRGTDIAAAEMIRNAFLRMENVQPANRDRSRPAARHMAEFLGQRISSTPTPYLTVTALSLMAQIRTTDTLSWLEPEIPHLGSQWGFWLSHAWRLAPNRTDLAIPLYSELAVRQRFDLLNGEVRRLLTRKPNDPVGLYFAGLLTVRASDPQAKRAGLAMIKEAVDQGLGRFMPIDPALQSLMGTIP